MTSRRVVIINCDDTVETRYTKTRVLRQAGHEVVECGTGQEALQKTRELMPDLVLLDVQLPDISGFDVCRRIKEDAITGIIPVIQISATFVTREYAREALKHGADIYLTEPLEPKELETVVSVLLRLGRTEAGLREALARERAARAQAEEATQIKDQFLANLSHELRTPMNIIIGWSHLLRTGPLDDSQRQRATEAIERAARSQAQLIEDLLDVSRIVAGKFRLVQQDVDAGRILQLAIDSLKLVGQAKQLTIALSIEGDDARISGDPDRLQQVFWNLLSNAVKFTPSGGRVDARLITSPTQVSIEVTDTGVGIDPEFLPYVFERFRQADSTSTRQHSGIGLGLAIVRHVVELHGGTGGKCRGRQRRYVHSHPATAGNGSATRLQRRRRSACGKRCRRILPSADPGVARRGRSGCSRGYRGGSHKVRFRGARREWRRESARAVGCVVARCRRVGYRDAGHGRI